MIEYCKYIAIFNSNYDSLKSNTSGFLEDVILFLTPVKDHKSRIPKRVPYVNTFQIRLILY